jgi:hypothetical protein
MRRIPVATASPSSASDPATVQLDRVAGSVLLGGSALLIYGIFLYVGGEEDSKVTVIGASLLVTLFGLIAFEEALRDRGERLLPRFGSIAFAIGSTFWIARDTIGQGTGLYVFELERAYTVLICLSIALFGWSILRTKALPLAVGWLAIAWGLLDAYLYVARISTPPLAPNLMTLVLGAALVASAMRSSRARPPARASVEE